MPLMVLLLVASMEDGQHHSACIFPAPPRDWPFTFKQRSTSPDNHGRTIGWARRVGGSRSCCCRPYSPARIIVIDNEPGLVGNRLLELQQPRKGFVARFGRPVLHNLAAAPRDGSLPAKMPGMPRWMDAVHAARTAAACAAEERNEALVWVAVLGFSCELGSIPGGGWRWWRCLSGCWCLRLRGPRCWGWRRRRRRRRWWW